MTSIDNEFIGLLHQIHNHNIPSHPYRGYAILHKNETCLIKKIEVSRASFVNFLDLRKLVQNLWTWISFRPQQFNERPRQVMFVYTNYLSDWSNIYRSLMDINIFQTTIEECAKILTEKFGINLINILDNGSPVKSLFKGFMSAVTIQVINYFLLIWTGFQSQPTYLNQNLNNFLDLLRGDDSSVETYRGFKRIIWNYRSL